MAITVDATVGGANANSYITVAYASTYFEGRLNVGNWTAASAGDKDISVVMATRVLDDWVDWEGYRVDEEEDQALRWPRYGAVSRDGFAFDSDVIPGFLQRATAELALFLLGSDLTAEPDTKGFKELSVGSLRLVIDRADRDGATLIPDAVKAMIEPYGRVRARGGSMSAGLVRT